VAIEGSEQGLEPGGLCLALAGKAAIKEVLDRMSKQLAYWWMLDIYKPGAVLTDLPYIFSRKKINQQS